MKMRHAQRVGTSAVLGLAKMRTESKSVKRAVLADEPAWRGGALKSDNRSSCRCMDVR